MSKAYKRIVYVLLFILVGALTCVGSKIVTLHNTQEPTATKIMADDLSKFEYVDINSPNEIGMFFYSFTPDGSGIIYAYKEWNGHNKNRPLGYTFHFLDFKTKNQWIIHEIDFADEIDQQVSSSNNDQYFIYWLNPELVVLGADKFSGLCGPENSIGLAAFDLKSRKNVPVTYVDSACSENSEHYQQEISQLYGYSAENSEDLKIFRFSYSTSYSNEAYLFLEGNDTISVFVDTLSEASLESDLHYRLETVTPASFYINENFDVLSRDSIYAKKPRINSRDEKYYFMFTSTPSDSDLPWWGKLNPGRESSSEEYIEIYSWDNKPIKKVFYGYSGMIPNPLAEPTGYIDFWSNDNKVVLVKAMEGGVYYRVYFIDLETK
jgi:hypothetical protein